MKRILCFGDSITKGHPGVTYIKYLSRNKKYKNFGLPGDTVIGMTKRLIKTIKRNKYQDIEGIIVGIGANDIIQPFLKNYSTMWGIRVKMLKKRGSIACDNIKQFEFEYIKLIEILKETNKKIIIFSMPYLETNLSDLNSKIKEYNQIIKKLCNQYNIPFIDYYSWQEQTKKNSENTNFSFMSKNPLLVGLDTLITSYLQLSSYVSNKRKLDITVDGCHLNKYAAFSLAQMIEKNYELNE